MTDRVLGVVVIILATAQIVSAQAGTWPTAVEELSLPSLAGQWYEVAAFGSWSHRRCNANTRFEWALRDSRTVDVRSSCATGTTQEVRTGRLRASAGTHRGRLAVRFAPAFLGWLPAAWSDHWVLAVGEEQRWLLIGDRRRSKLSVMSRFAVLDEASYAQAIRVARFQGFDVDRLVAVPQLGNSEQPVP